MYATVSLYMQIQTGEARGPFKSLPPVLPKLSVRWLHRAVIVLITSLCLILSDADI